VAYHRPVIPTAHIEREVKLEAGVGFRIPDLRGLIPGIRVEEHPDARLQAVYVDTEDLRLMRNGITLRHRQDRRGGAGAERGWTLKLPAPSDGKGLVRKELSWPGGWGPVPRPAASLVRAFNRGAPLVPVARLITQRRRLVVSDLSGQELLEVDDDIVSVMDGRILAARFREVEVEVTGPGGESLLEAVVACLRDAGALGGDERPKVVRALGRRATQPPDVAEVALGADATVREVIAAAIVAGYRRLTEHDPGVRLDGDVEDVHQARVATRRLRSDLRTFAGVVDGAWSTPVRQELGWIAEALGRVRDADVLGLRIDERVAGLDPQDRPGALPLRKRLDLQRRDAFRDLIAAMDSERYLALLDTLATGALDPPLIPAPRPAPAPNGLAERARQAPAAALADGTADGTATTVPALANGESGVFSGALPAPRSGGGMVGRSALGGPVGAPFRLTGATETVPSASDVTGEPDSDLDWLDSDEAEDDGELGEFADRPAVPEQGVAPGGIDPPETAVEPADPATGWAGLTGDELASEALPQLVRKPWRRLVRAINDLAPEPVDEALHDIRIRAKRLRYACEAVAMVVGKSATRLAKDAAALQGVLGDQHDAVVAEDWLRDASVGAKGLSALVAGQLIAGERGAQQLGRDEWGELARRVTNPEHRVWLRKAESGS
jgi:CHAD domain-containing protein